MGLVSIPEEEAQGMTIERGEWGTPPGWTREVSPTWHLPERWSQCLGPAPPKVVVEALLYRLTRGQCAAVWWETDRRNPFPKGGSRPENLPALRRPSRSLQQRMPWCPA